MFHVFAALAEFERSVIRERTRAGLDAARARGRRGGRPRSLGEGDLAAARAMLRDPAITVGEVARRLGVGPATLYRHLPGGRGALGDGAGPREPRPPREEDPDPAIPPPPAPRGANIVAPGRHPPRR